MNADGERARWQHPVHQDLDPLLDNPPNAAAQPNPFTTADPNNPAGTRDDNPARYLSAEQRELLEGPSSSSPGNPPPQDTANGGTGPNDTGGGGSAAGAGAGAEARVQPKEPGYPSLTQIYGHFPQNERAMIAWAEFLRTGGAQGSRARAEAAGEVLPQHVPSLFDAESEQWYRPPFNT